MTVTIAAKTAEGQGALQYVAIWRQLAKVLLKPWILNEKTVIYRQSGRAKIHLRFGGINPICPLTQQRTCLCHILGSWLRNDVKRSGSTMGATPLWLVRWTVL
jgi:hypothetical protein